MRLLPFVLIVLLAACGSTPKDLDRATYDCEEGTRLDVMFEPGQAIVTLIDGTMLTLDQEESLSGFIYTSGKYTLRGKGGHATWTKGRRAPILCTAQ